MKIIRSWRNGMRRVSRTALLIFFAGSLSAGVQAETWRQEIVDASGGKFSSLQVDNYGNAHVVYADDEHKFLKYAFWDRKIAKWFTTIVDNRGAGFCSLALDSQQHPHVSYLEYGTGHLKYAHWDGSSWKLEAIRLGAAHIEFYTSITLDPEDHPAISYYETIGAGSPDLSLRLRNVKWNGQLWQARTIDWTQGSGKFNSIAEDSDGRPHVAYANVRSETASLRYGIWNGSAWQIEILEGADRPSPMYSVSMVLEKGGIPHITYTDVARHLVKYASRKDGRWQLQVVGSLTQEGYPDRNGIALDGEGNPYISYFDAGRGVLILVHRENQKWIPEEVDNEFSGFNSSIRIANGEVIVMYFDSRSGGLKCARRVLVPTGSPSREVASGMSKVEQKWH
jgi:hypothetical protein